jgi:hypothetical protein
MPYLITAKIRPLVMRDGVGHEAPSFKLPVGKAVPFSDLPPGVPESGDAEVAVKAIDQEEYTKLRAKRGPSLKEQRAKRLLGGGTLTQGEASARKKLEKIATGKQFKPERRAKAVAELEERFGTTAGG